MLYASPILLEGTFAAIPIRLAGDTIMSVRGMPVTAYYFVTLLEIRFTDSIQLTNTE